MSCLVLFGVAGCAAGTGLNVSVSASVPLSSVTMMAAIHLPKEQGTHQSSVKASLNGATMTSFTILLPDADENVALTITALTATGQTLTQKTSQPVAAHTWHTLSVELGPSMADDGGAALDLTRGANDGGTALDLGEAERGDMATPPITLVQEVTAGATKAGNSREATITLAAGDLVVVATFWNDNSSSVTVNDSAGNVWQSIESAPTNTICANKNGPRVQLRYVTNAKPGTTTITVTQSGMNASLMGFFVLEYANVKHSMSIDAEHGASAAAASNVMSPGSVTTTDSDDLIVALFNDPEITQTMRSGLGYHTLAVATSPFALVEDNLPSTLPPGQYAPTAYLPAGVSDNCWAATTAAFRPR
jgi:hypothetical protein